jgi:hypothetical protein
MSVKLFDDVKVEVVSGELKNIYFGQATKEVDVKKYSEIFNKGLFDKRVDELFSLLESRSSGKVLLADKDSPLRCGAGCANLLKEMSTGKVYLIGPQRNETAPRMPNMIDVAAGLVEDSSIQRTMVREGIEEVLKYVNSTSNGSKSIISIVLLPEFSDFDSYSCYNSEIEEKIKEQVGKLNLFSAYLPVNSRMIPLKNRTKATIVLPEGPKSFEANIGFEPMSIEVIGTKLIELPHPLNINDITSHDAEFLSDGIYLSRRSLIIDAESGYTRIFKEGRLDGNLPLEKYLETINPRYMEGKVRIATVKVASVVGNWDESILGTNEGLKALLNGYTESMYVLPRIK